MSFSSSTVFCTLFAQTEIWGVRLGFQKLLQLNVVHKLWIYYENQIVKERKPQSGTDITQLGVIVAFQQTFLKNRRSSWALPSSLHHQDGHLKSILPVFHRKQQSFSQLQSVEP